MLGPHHSRQIKVQDGFFVGRVWKCDDCTNDDGTQKPSLDRIKAIYTFNIQRAVHVPSFKFHLISVSLLVNQSKHNVFSRKPAFTDWLTVSFFLLKGMVFFGSNMVQKSWICRRCPLLRGMQNFNMWIVKHWRICELSSRRHGYFRFIGNR